MKFYGLPKLNKHREPNEAPPFRPIVSSINAYNYKLTKYLCTILSLLILTEYTTSFTDEVTSFDCNNKFLISYDVNNLFTDIPLTKTIDIAINLIFEDNPNFPIKKTDLKQLFLITTNETHFLFHGPNWWNGYGLFFSTNTGKSFYGFSQTALKKQLRQSKTFILSEICWWHILHLPWWKRRHNYFLNTSIRSI